jgi:hypothetical protein
LTSKTPAVYHVSSIDKKVQVAAKVLDEGDSVFRQDLITVADNPPGEILVVERTSKASFLVTIHQGRQQLKVYSFGAEQPPESQNQDEDTEMSV